MGQGGEFGWDLEDFFGFYIGFFQHSGMCPGTFLGLMWATVTVFCFLGGHSLLELHSLMTLNGTQNSQI